MTYDRCCGGRAALCCWMGGSSTGAPVVDSLKNEPLQLPRRLSYPIGSLFFLFFSHPLFTRQNYYRAALVTPCTTPPRVTHTLTIVRLLLLLLLLPVVHLIEQENGKRQELASTQSSCSSYYKTGAGKIQIKVGGSSVGRILLRVVSWIFDRKFPSTPKVDGRDAHLLVFHAGAAGPFVFGLLSSEWLRTRLVAPSGGKELSTPKLMAILRPDDNRRRRRRRRRSNCQWA